VPNVPGFGTEDFNLLGRGKGRKEKKGGVLRNAYGEREGGGVILERVVVSLGRIKTRAKEGPDLKKSRNTFPQRGLGQGGGLVGGRAGKFVRRETAKGEKGTIYRKREFWPTRPKEGGVKVKDGSQRRRNGTITLL